jgi:ribosomal protein L11 methyltransferase
MNPPTTLYVYEARGKLPELRGVFGEDLIGCWQEDLYAFLFFRVKKEEGVRKVIGQLHDATYLSEVVIDYRDWSLGDGPDLLRVGPLVVSPVWESYVPTHEEIHVRLDPGIVFGSGNHPTSRHCLHYLLNLHAEGHVRRVLDLGAGTGILAIACAKLGAQKVHAVDNNRLAVETVRKNADINRVGGKVCAIHGDAQHFLSLPADLLIANLHRETIEHFLDSSAFYGHEWFILSGLHGAGVHSVIERLRGSPLEVVDVRSENFWFTVLARGT